MGVGWEMGRVRGWVGDRVMWVGEWVDGEEEEGLMNMVI